MRTEGDAGVRLCHPYCVHSELTISVSHRRVHGWEVVNGRSGLKLEGKRAQTADGRGLGRWTWQQTWVSRVKLEKEHPPV